MPQDSGPHRAAVLVDNAAAATTEEIPAVARFAAAARSTITRRVLRAADQLDVVVELLDADVVDGEVVPSGARPAIRLTFGSQHVAERTFGAAVPKVPLCEINHVAAGPNVVVAPIDASVPFTLDALLDLAVAAVVGQDHAGVPDGGATALEVPASLVVSPSAPATLVTNRAPITAGDTTETWTARFERPEGRLELAAIHNLSPTDLVTTRVPDAAARDHLVVNTTTISPLTARRLWLSAAGAFADLHGAWTIGLADYDHRIVAGRDIKVRVVSLGYLLPFGHRAAVTEVAERAIVDDEGGGQTSVMQVERFLSVVEPTVTTPRAFARDGGRGLPLLTITASTTEAAPIVLDPVLDGAGAPIDGASDITFREGGDDVLVEYLSVDRGGNRVSFALPATFIDDAAAYETGAGGASARLRALVNDVAYLARRQVDLHGQSVAYADPLGSAGGTSKPTHRFTLQWDGPADGSTADDLATAGSPAVFGVLAHADVIDDVVASVTGGQRATVGVTLHPRWLSVGNVPDNFDLAYLTLDVPSTSLVGAGSAIGGVAQLESVAEVFNQLTGIGPLLDDPTASWDPEAMLGDASRIVGNILLSSVVDLVVDGLPGVDVPGTTVTVGDDGTVTSSFSFCPQLKDLPSVGFRTVPGETRCCLHITSTASLSDGIEATATTEMRVENFLLEFPPVAVPLVRVDFESVVGTISSEGPADVVPTIREWDFSGAISMLRRSSTSSVSAASTSRSSAM